MHCVYLALLTHGFVWKFFLCALYKFLFIHSFKIKTENRGCSQFVKMSRRPKTRDSNVITNVHNQKYGELREMKRNEIRTYLVEGRQLHLR